MFLFIYNSDKFQMMVSVQLIEARQDWLTSGITTVVATDRLTATAMLATARIISLVRSFPARWHQWRKSQSTGAVC